MKHWHYIILILWIAASMTLAAVLVFWLVDYYYVPTYTPGVIAPQTEQATCAAIENITPQPREEPSMIYSKNQAGWLQVSGVGIDEPVMQTDNNSFYLTHNALDEYDVHGACFALNTSNLGSIAELSRVTVLFGHNAGNTDNPGFSRLKKLKDQQFAAENRYIYLQLSDGRLTAWEIFAAGDYPVSYDYLIAEPDDDYFLWQLDEIKSRSFCTYEGVAVTEQDHIIILSTCSSDKNARYIVCGVLVG